MNRMLSATGLAVIWAVSLGAQTPSTPAGQDPSKATSAAAEKSITLKGCLRAGDQPDAFVLANAASTSETAGTAGTTAAPAMKNQTVRLIGSPAGMNLKDHVGHTVEVSGMIVPQGAKPSTPAAAPGAATSPGAATGAAPAATANDGPRLNVKNVKHVDAKCGA